MAAEAARVPRRKRMDAAARRETILAAAIPAFATAGYERTRVADIAASIGVTEPVVFQNFGTKAELFAAALDRAADEVVVYLADLGARSRDVAELLSALLDPRLQDELHSRGGIGMLFLEAFNRSEASIQDAARRANQRTVEALAAVLRRGQGEGSIRADADAGALAWLVVCQVHARQFRRAHAAEVAPALEREMLEALLDVLRAPRRG